MRELGPWRFNMLGNKIARPKNKPLETEMFSGKKLTKNGTSSSKKLHFGGAMMFDVPICKWLGLTY